MDKEYKKEHFETLKIKSSVAKKFRRFSLMLSKSQSVSLLLMLEFFEHNGISPAESMGPKMQTLEILIKKRINGVIAILRDIEKNKVNPTLGILESLMEAAEPKKTRLYREKKDYEQDDTHPDFYK